MKATPFHYSPKIINFQSTVLVFSALVVAVALVVSLNVCQYNWPAVVATGHTTMNWRRRKKPRRDALQIDGMPMSNTKHPDGISKVQQWQIAERRGGEEA